MRAITPGGWNAAHATSGPRRTRSVEAASAASIVHASRGPRSPRESLYSRWSPSQMDTNPLWTAARAIVRYSVQGASRSTSGSWTPMRKVSAAEHPVASEVSKYRLRASVEDDHALPGDRPAMSSGDGVPHAPGLEGGRRDEELEHLGERQIGDHVPGGGERPRNDRGRALGDLAPERRQRGDHQTPLVERSAEVAVRQVVTHAGKRQRFAPREVLRTATEVSVRPHIADRIRDLQVDPAHCFHHSFEPLEAREEVGVHPDTAQPLDGVDEQLRPAEDERCVDLVGAVSGDRDPRVAWDPHDRYATMARVHGDDVDG